LSAFHDAFGYFGHHYGLDFVGSIALGDAASPGARDWRNCGTGSRRGAWSASSRRSQHDPALIEQMAEGTGAKIGGALDPVGSSLEPGPGAYAALLTGLAQTIADCAGG
jgi:zinc transport system substrate-binding protein